MTTRITDRLNKRMASQTLSEFVSADCVVESDELGPRLWEVARKGLTVGLAAMMLFTSYPVAAAQSGPIMPGSEISEQYVGDVSRSIESAGRLAGMKLKESFAISAKLDDTNLAPESWPIRITDPFFGAKTCYASFSAGKDAAAVYRLAANVGNDFDIGRYEEMKAASFCAIWSSLPNAAIRAYNNTDLGLSVISDVVTALATAKYDTAKFGDVYDLQTAIALSALRSGSEYEQGGALVRLGALRTAADYISTAQGARNISAASVEDLVEVSHILIKQSQGEIIRSGKSVQDIAEIETAELPTALEKAGLTAIAKAIEDVRESGLSTESDYFPLTAKSGCDDITRGTVRQQRRSRAYCKMWEQHGWQVEDGATFVGDFANYANTRLQQPQQSDEQTVGFAR
jgi:hypothetical protein|nr:hypothetical protein [Neorhizobium tomejilense]